MKKHLTLWALLLCFAYPIFSQNFKVENYIYPARGENGEYTLKNDWLYSNTLDNFAPNRPWGTAGYVRGMVAKNDIMYFIDREYTQLVRVDGKTGETLEPIPFADNIFTQVFKDVNGNDSIGRTKTLITYNDIQKDAAGNILIGAIVRNTDAFQIWKIDETTGNGTLLIEETLWDNPVHDSLNYRLDYFGVYGDVDKHAIIMAADGLSMSVFKWTINDGKVEGLAERIELHVGSTDNLFSETYKSNSNNVPRIYPINDEYFYVDGWSTYPTLFKMDGTFVGDFKNCPTGLQVVNNAGDTTTLQTQQNGVMEFQIGEDYFLLMTATGTSYDGNNFALYKYKDATKSFADIEPLWFFPNDGMGGAMNGSRSAPVSVEVNQETGVAHVYVYAAENGYGRYTLQGVAGKATGISLSTTSCTIDNGDSCQLAATVLPATANQNVVWTSSNRAVATVTNGLIQAKHSGKAIITATSVDGGLIATCEVTVISPPVESVHINPSELRLTLKTSSQLTATVLPTNADNQNVRWSTTNPTVALVTDGLVVAVGVGEATIIATTEEGGFTDSCHVIVDIPVTGILLKPSSLLLAPNNAEQLVATILPENATNKHYSWTVDNPSIVTLLDNGWIVARTEGKTLVTATTEDGEYTATCEVTVQEGVQDEVVSNVTINPNTNSVDFTWSSVANAASYVFIIYEDTEQMQKLCTLTFNAQGQLTNINFSRNKPATTREPQKTFFFTVTGLEPQTTYTYTMGTFDEANAEIESTAGIFTTSSMTTNTTDPTTIVHSYVQKIFEDGTIYILRGDERYTIDGRKVE